MIFMASILLVAVIRVWRILRDEGIVLLNTKYMAVHASLLFILAGAITINYISYLQV
jgi:hypothetical protein